MGGLGKTTLARKVYNRGDVKQYFDCLAWVYVSQEFTIRELLLVITTSVMVIFDKQKSKMDETWDKLFLYFPNLMNGSRVVITTRNKEIAPHANPFTTPYELRVEELGKKIVAKCRGLLLAIVVLRGLLSRKEKTQHSWRKVLDNVNWHLNKEIQVKRLTLLWIAKGFIQKKGEATMKDIAKDYLEELIHRSMIQLAGRGFSDANWILDSDEMKFTNGYVFILGGSVVSWKSAKQTRITRSTMEAEFIALENASSEAEWLGNLLADIPLWTRPASFVSMRCDSQAAIAKAKSKIFNGKNKHIRLRHNIMRQLLKIGVISLEFVRSELNLADHLTKPLNKKLVEETSRGMRLMPITKVKSAGNPTY
ncbi:putative disease resistance RPP13-like protein 3 [Vitis vinifera]|uniref:Putative disease resistance RPP13-like protein 3 n=1 Tax=Vitis vinifera TaxID=29760 RepID=A0A438GSP8_VITVI|nr:putative disease resistance RPP13-like protein 3 [Vitis vinifera]